MLPLTTHQVNDGVDAGDFMIDLTDYMKKKDAATKTEIESLTAILANKLDATPQHKHDIANIKDLREELDSKYDTSKRYSYNVILSDSEKIPYLEAPRVGKLDISCNSGRDGYVFYVDEANGDLMITLNDILIGSYSIAAGKWSFETGTSEIDNSIASLDKRIGNNEIVLENHYEALTAVCGATLKNITDIADNGTKITSLEAALNDYVAKTDAVLKNHYEAILLLCQKHGMVDGDGTDGDNISPQ